MQNFFLEQGGWGAWQTMRIMGDVNMANETFGGMLSHHEVAQETGLTVVPQNSPVECNPTQL